MYNSIIDVNKRFKSSVNLQFDLNNEEKILQYVPTTDLCDVIKIYVKSFLSDEGSRATTLSGPYGKGKSYLMLIITYLISNRNNRELFNKIVSKFRLIDAELADLILELDERHISLLPVVINNNNSDDFNQNFMLALSNTLTENGMTDIIPNSVFSECLDLIDKWETDQAGTDILRKCEQNLPISLKELKQRLSNYDVKAYKLFEQLFTCVSYGGKFNPLISNDIAFLYTDVSRRVKEYGYSGLFIVFDEFGVFLENQTTDFVTRLNKIQNLAEKCNESSVENQLHICCITHKDVTLYSKNKEANDQFMKIQGRFKAIRFDRSIEENYEIICSALEKKKGYEEYVNSFVSKQGSFINKLKQSEIFSLEQLDFLINNGLPFNPISLYTMISVSEKVGQNERTMFTFLSDSDLYTFRYFISNNNEGLLNVSNIYDYFSELIKDDENYKNIYYQVESLMKLTPSISEHMVLKTIAIMKIINDDIKFASTETNIHLSLGIDNVSETLNELCDKNFIKQDLISKCYNFSVLADKVLNEKINQYIETKLLNKDISELLNEFDSNVFYVSNRYNLEYSMIRYYRSIYVNIDVLSSINDCASLYDSFSDGLIIEVLGENLGAIDFKTILSNKNNNSNVIVRYNNKGIDELFINKIKTVIAANNLMTTKNVTEVEKNSLQLLISDLTTDLNGYLSVYKLHSNCVILDDELVNNIYDCIYITLRKTYNQTIIFNNDQVNKNVISRISAKARDNIVDRYLSNKELDFSTTSAEGTILSSLEDSIKSDDTIIKIIRNKFIESDGRKIKVNDLVKVLTSQPYGMRKGVIPLFISYVINSISISSKNEANTVLFYNKNKEIELNAINLTKAIESENEYSLMYRRIDNNNYKIAMNLLEFFNCKPTNVFIEDIKNLVQKMRKYIYNLEPVITSSNRNDNILKLSPEEIKFKDIFSKADLNSYDIIFEQLPNLFTDRNVLDGVESTAITYESKIKELYNTTISNTKLLLNNCDSPIKTCFDIWASDYEYMNQIIFEEDLKRIHNCFLEMKYSDEDSIDKLSVAVLNCSLTDWDSKKQTKFFDKITEYIDTVSYYNPENNTNKEEFVNEVDNTELTYMGKTLFSNLQDSIDEYGASITNEEKAIILKKLLNEIIN